MSLKKRVGWRLCITGIIYGLTVAAAEEPIDEFGSILDPLVNQKLIPGYYFAVYKGSARVYERSKGYADEQNELVPTEDTIYAMMSMSKPIISLAVLKLVDEGKIGLSDPLSKYLPAFDSVNYAPGGSYTNQLLTPKSKIKISDLLTHTSGLTYSSGIIGVGDVADAYRDLGVMTIESIAASRWGDLKGQIEKLVELPLVDEPGKRFVYSVSIDVLGRVIEVVTEQSLGRYLEESIFVPLEMRDTGFSVPKNRESRLAGLYAPLNRTYQIPGIPKRYQPSNIVPKGQKNFGLSSQGYESGGAGLLSTAKDYAKFMQVVLNAGREEHGRFISVQSGSLLVTDQIGPFLGKGSMVGSLGPQAENMGFSYGLGVTLEENGNLENPETYDYLGWQGAANTSFWVDPNKGISGIFLTQHIPIQYDVIRRLEDAAESVFNN